MDIIRERIKESIDLKTDILNNSVLLDTINDCAQVIKKAICDGKKIVLCGNGGSASDAAHIAGELIGRFQKERKPIAAISLPNDFVSMTAIANDYNYKDVFAREVEGLINQGDVFVGISTSGNSENVLRAVKKAKVLGAITISLLGRGGGRIKDSSDFAIVVPSGCTARVQECHIMIGHILCEIVENDT